MPKQHNQHHIYRDANGYKDILTKAGCIDFVPNVSPTAHVLDALKFDVSENRCNHLVNYERILFLYYQKTKKKLPNQNTNTCTMKSEKHIIHTSTYSMNIKTLKLTTKI